MKTVFVIKSDAPKSGKGVWVDPPVRVVDEARRTGRWPGTDWPVVIEEVVVPL